MKYGILSAGITLIILMASAWSHNQKMQVPDTDHWIACDSCFFYNTNSYQEGDWYKAELHTLNVCSNHSKRGTHEPTWNTSDKKGILSHNSDSVQIDGLLVINMELSPRNHHDTIVAYGYEK